MFVKVFVRLFAEIIYEIFPPAHTVHSENSYAILKKI